MAKRQVKIGQTKTNNPISRHSISNFVVQAQKGKPWRGYPMERYFVMEVIKKWYVPTVTEAKSIERDFKGRFVRDIEVGKEVNGESEIRSLSNEELQIYVEFLDNKYPLTKRPKDYVVLYMCDCFQRPEPLPVPQILIDTFSIEWRN